ncbi:MAG: hypothetical protein ACXVB6_16185 [Mucilaginibacter sp.]
MRKLKIFCLLSFCSVIGVSRLYAQVNKNSADSLAKTIEQYALKKASSSLFTFFDKNVYVNNENVWFTSYLLDYSRNANKPTIMSLILVDDSCHSIALQQKYPIIDGLCFGHFLIPDSIPAGDYRLITYTNILTNGTPIDIFTQPITIKEPTSRAFTGSLTMADTNKNANTDSQKVLLKLEDLSHHPIVGATAIWNLGGNQNLKHDETVKTDSRGQYMFSIPRNLNLQGYNILNVSAKYLNDTKNFQIVLPSTIWKPDIKFFAEGGELVEGVESVVGWEAKTALGIPAEIKGVLYKDGKTIDTIATNQYGIGRFKLNPVDTGKYIVKVIGDASDSNYFVPRAMKKGVVLTLKKALLNDSLRINLKGNYPQKYTIVIHNYRQVFYSFPIEINAGGKIIEVNLKPLPKGLNTITVLDSLRRPCAERIFFAHYSQRTPINVSVDRQEYGIRQKVKVKLSLDSACNDSTRAAVTIACVQSSRVLEKKSNDIASYIYLRNELETLPVKEDYMGQNNADKDYLEKILLVKGWRRYKWERMAEATANFVSNKETKMMINGSVSYHGKPLKKSTHIMVRTDSTTNVILTDVKGNFQLGNNLMLTNERKRVYLLAEYSKDEGYKIQTTNDFSKLNDSLRGNLVPTNYSLPGFIYDNYEIKNPLGLKRPIRLKEVQIKSRNDNIYKEESLANLSLKPERNVCGDWVCRYNVLNCSLHPLESDNTLPIIGRTYFSDGSHVKVTYKGCTVVSNKLETTSFDGINYPKEFYGSDYSRFSQPEPEYQSTLFWKHIAYLNKKKEAELSFYTSDLTGRFQIVVQGVSSSDLIYKKIEFSVSKQ